MAENERNTWMKEFIVLLIVVIGFAVFVGMFGFGMIGSGMMGFGWPFMLLSVILIIILIYALTLVEKHTNILNHPALEKSVRWTPQNEGMLMARLEEKSILK